MADSVVVGIDIGTTGIKAAAIDRAGEIIALARTDSHWTVQGELAETTAAEYADAISRVLNEVDNVLDPETTVAGIGITGLAETGVGLAHDDDCVVPSIAWHDPRGAEQMAQFAQEGDFVTKFCRATGLLYDAQSTFAKLAWMQDNWVCSRVITDWLSIPEYIAYQLTGAKFAEPSLVSRTGLWDHRHGKWWQGAKDRLSGLGFHYPEVRPAGEPWGQVVGFSPRYDGAVVTVAGHDHPVASFGAGVRTPGVQFNSCGTADVILRTTDRWPTRRNLARLSEAGITIGNHVVPGSYISNGLVRTGLALKTVKSLLGVTDHAVLEEMYLGPEADTHRITVAIPGNDGPTVNLAIAGEVTPEQVWTAAINAGTAASGSFLALLDKAFGPAHHTIAGGGWTRSQAIRTAKEALFGEVDFVAHAEPGCRGAAGIAWCAVDGQPLAGFEFEAEGEAGA